MSFLKAIGNGGRNGEKQPHQPPQPQPQPQPPQTQPQQLLSPQQRGNHDIATREDDMSHDMSRDMSHNLLSEREEMTRNDEPSKTEKMKRNWAARATTMPAG